MLLFYLGEFIKMIEEIYDIITRKQSDVFSNSLEYNTICKYNE